VHVETSADFFNSDGTNLRTSNTKFNPFSKHRTFDKFAFEKVAKFFWGLPQDRNIDVAVGSGAGGIRIPVMILAIDRCSSHEEAL
jgi:hypothetical protein